LPIVPFLLRTDASVQKMLPIKVILNKVFLVSH
jgi:hypothetical protein